MAMRYRLLIAALLVFGISASSARADPVTVRSGSFTVAFDDPSSFNISGDGLVLSGLFVRIASSPQQQCLPGCLPGATINLSAVAGGPSAGSLGQSFTAVLDGVPLTVPNQPDTWLNLTGDFVFTAGDIVLPPLTPVGSGAVMSPAPFTFEGQVSGFRRGDPSTSIFALDLTGQGTASFRVVSSPNGTFVAPEVTYRFEDVAPVPEPGTMMLFLTGAAGLILRRRAPTAA